MLRLENIRIQLGNFSLQDIDLHIRAGEYRVLLGPTGTGKTVLLETIAGLYLPQQGRILLNGRDITRTAPEDRHMGIVYQDYALFPHLSVYDNIAFGPKLQGITAREIQQKVREMAGFLRIDHILKRSPRNLSGGESQRVALARALVLNPHLLLLDEPLSAVDRLTRDHLRGELRKIHKQLGLAVLHITHDLDESFFLGTSITIMRQGRILQEGSPEEICRYPTTRFIGELMGNKNFIPARVTAKGDIEIKKMGFLDRKFLTSPPGQTQNILLSFPGWSVEISSRPDPSRYFWQGLTRIKEIRLTDRDVEVDLELPDTTRIQTTFSRREMNLLPFPLEAGKMIEIGILNDQMHWLPLPED